MRRLRLPQAGARHGGFNLPVRVGAFERVGHGHGKYAALRLVACRINQAAEGFGGQAAAGGIVHQNIVVCRRQAAVQQRVHAVAHGFGTAVAAAFEQADFVA